MVGKQNKKKELFLNDDSFQHILKLSLACDLSLLEEIRNHKH